jgi:hypothetical protein
MTTTTTIDERRAELAELEARAEQAAGLERTISSLRRDLERFEARRDRFKALGNGHVTLETESFDQRYGCSIVFVTGHSKLSGRELAAQAEENAAALRREIKSLEAEVGRLLSSR